MSKFQIVCKDTNKSYGIYKIGPKCHRIVKNLKDYSDDQEAISILMKLLDGKITEKDLLGDSHEQDVAAGKLSNKINILEATLESIREDLLQSLDDNDKLDKAAREVLKRVNDLVELGNQEQDLNCKSL